MLLVRSSVPFYPMLSSGPRYGCAFIDAATRNVMI